MTPQRIYRCLPLTMAAAILAGSSASPQAANSNALWWIVRNVCVPFAELVGVTSPCEFAELDKGTDERFVILTDLRKKTRVLLVPTDRISGIDDPKILASGAPNYWQYAWEARTYVEQRAAIKLTRDDIGLAINSALARTQDQLHIHIGCIRPSVRAALRRREPAIGKTWSKLDVLIAGHRYMAMRVEAEDMQDVNPFRLLAATAAKTRMPNQTLVVIGTTFTNGKNGFYVLSNAADPAKHDIASGEDLLDDRCSARSG